MADVIGSFERGFSLGDRIIRAGEDREQRERDREWQNKARSRQEQQWSLADEDRARQLAREEEDIAWKAKARARQEKDWSLADEELERRLEREKGDVAWQEKARGQQELQWARGAEDHKTQKERSDYAFKRQQKADFFKDNMPLIEQGWTEWKETGVLPEIFDSEHAKGTPYDPRSWTPGKYAAGLRIERMMPDLISGRIKPSDPDFIDVYGEFYKPNVEASIGTVDEATGKTITGAKLSRVDSVADIDPNTPGNQAGFILSSEITYDDGTTAIKPITNDRSSSPSDNPRVIPYTAAMQDLTSQLGLMREATSSAHFDSLFKKQSGDKSKAEMTKEYLKTQDDLDKERAKALANAMSDEDALKINQQFDKVAANIELRYAPFITDKKESKRSSSTDPQAFSETMRTVRSFANNYDVPTESMAEIREGLRSGRITIEQAQNFISDSFSSKSPSTEGAGAGAQVAPPAGNAGDDALLANMRQTAGGNENVPAEDLSQYEAMSDDELMAMTNEGDTVAMTVLRERNLKRNEGRMMALPGGTTREERELGKQRLAEYNRLMAEGRIEEANRALYGTPAETSLAQAGQ